MDLMLTGKSLLCNTVFPPQQHDLAIHLCTSWGSKNRLSIKRKIDLKQSSYTKKQRLDVSKIIRLKIRPYDLKFDLTIQVRLIC